jgi:ribonuclease HII
MNKYYSKSKLEVGIDEVGRGCLAGPVVAAAVIWPKDINDDLELQITDSKKLSRKKRNELRYFIEENAIDFSVAFIDEKIIDKKNIFNATQLAMHKALDKLNTIPELILVDGDKFKPYIYNNDIIENICIIKGDLHYKSIACASILAKEYHDDYIKKICETNISYNNYDLLNNMGYGTKKHIDAIKKNGIIEIHRKTFGICKLYNF